MLCYYNLKFFNFILMFDLGLFFIFQNIFILMLVFWILSFVGDKFFKVKIYTTTNEIYECGFLSTHKLKITFNMGFLLVMLLLILYDIEFFFLIPLFFNLTGWTLVSILIYWSFFLFILMSFVLDWELTSLSWTC